MSDDLTKRGKPDQIRVNVHEEWELKHRAQEWGVTQDQIKTAVKKVGPMVSDVKRELGK